MNPQLPRRAVTFAIARDQQPRPSEVSDRTGTSQRACSVLNSAPALYASRVGPSARRSGRDATNGPAEEPGRRHQKSVPTSSGAELHNAGRS